MSVLQKFLLITGALAGGYLVLTNPAGFASFANGVKTIVGGTETQIITGGKR